VGDGQPALGGLTKVRANLVESLPLGVAAGKCGNRCGIAAGFWFRVDNRGEIDGTSTTTGVSVVAGWLIVNFLQEL
jgi:hypothetical protein